MTGPLVHDGSGDEICLPFICIVLGSKDKSGSAHSRVLLQDVSQLVGQNPFSFYGRWGITTRVENHVSTNGIGQSIHGPRRFGSRGVGVDADAAEVVSEAGLEEGARRGV